jgi:molecular chaperone DnaK
VHVSAKDLATSKEQSIRITASSGLSKEEIEKMVKEATAHSEEDKKKKELAEVRNEADTLAYSVEKSLADFGEKISEPERNTIKDKIAATRKAMEGSDPGRIRTAVQELTQASHKLAEEIYKKNASQTPPGGSGPEGPAGSTGPSGSPGDQAAQGGEEKDKSQEKVVDAEFEETDKEKRSWGY